MVQYREWDIYSEDDRAIGTKAHLTVHDRRRKKCVLLPVLTGACNKQMGKICIIHNSAQSPTWGSGNKGHCGSSYWINPLNAELNPICYLLALLAHHFLHVSRIRVKSLTLTLLMSYIYIYICIYIYTYIYIYMELLFLMFLDHTQRCSTVGRTPLD